MKAEELMIGDWVLHDREHYQIRQLGIYGVDRDGEDYPAVCIGKPKGVGLIVERDEIEPIPLTPEILEKNGFVTNDEQGNWKGYRIYSLFNTDKSCIFMMKLYEKDSICEISLNMIPYYIVFKFVHQLQHALRLCGIEKEIVLQ